MKIKTSSLKAKTKKMGISSSSATSQVESDMMTSLSTTCENQPAQSTQILNCANIVIDNCNNFHEICNNQFVAKLSCTSDQVASAANKSAANASSAAKAALGIAFSKSMAANSSKLSTDISSACGTGQSVNQNQSAFNLRCENSKNVHLEFINSADIETQCLMGEASKAIQQAAASSSSTASGWDPLGEFLDTLSGGLKIVVIAAIIIACLIVVAVIAMLLFRKSGSADQLQEIGQRSPLPGEGYRNGPPPPPPPQQWRGGQPPRGPFPPVNQNANLRPQPQQQPQRPQPRPPQQGQIPRPYPGPGQGARR